MAADTVQRYKTSYKHTEEFIAHQYHVSDLNIEQLDHKFITDYEFYLKTVRNCSNNTTIKYLKNFKKIIRIALANNYLSVDPFAQVQFKLDEVVQEFLEEHELNRIINKEFSVPRLEQVRDVFVFCCYTGLAFSDVKQLRAEHIFVDNSGAHWIRKQRQKTNVMCTIPILDVAQEILDKYKDSPACKDGQLLPVLSNQKHNADIKEIMDVCGITKKISSHTARHTAATVTFLGNGVSIENVAKMLGHTNTKMTHRYAKVLDSNVFSQMQDVNSKINTKKVC